MAEIDVKKLPGYQPGVMHVDEKTMAHYQLPLYERSWCAHALIDLNQCRRKEGAVPWKCGHERHVFEMCNYKDWLRQKRNMILKQKAESEQLKK